jgi:hypothetical protein
MQGLRRGGAAGVGQRQRRPRWADGPQRGVFYTNRYTAAATGSRAQQRLRISRRFIGGELGAERQQYTSLYQRQNLFWSNLACRLNLT